MDYRALGKTFTQKRDVQRDSTCAIGCYDLNLFFLAQRQIHQTSIQDIPIPPCARDCLKLFSQKLVPPIAHPMPVTPSITKISTPNAIPRTSNEDNSHMYNRYNHTRDFNPFPCQIQQ